MAEPNDERLEDSPEKVRQGWVNRRREKIAAEIARNRRGDYKVPTWVLATILLAIIAAWALLVILS
ncbi:hypothetical protein [Polymorphospora rubra]|uniref:Uncharacterized protein n=1 Tax=Polymorphospora rubra TaxID=338584 RepID=A0A810NE94_9ACTN|nr:hypothetical protein [Polymorphospora rubra]BCJ69803.1 hypothetical protein Prubr_68240 [Polymorphospora rubra]